MKIKRILPFILALALIFSLTVPAFAAPEDEQCEHEWYEVTVPGCVTNEDLFSPEDIGTLRICMICGEQEFISGEPCPGDHSGDPFVDIYNTEAYHDFIIAGSVLGIVKGYPGGLFCPYEKVTRAQFITMLWRTAGEPEPQNGELSFADASSFEDWYVDAVAWGVENNIIKGFEDNTFRPDDNIDRAQMACFIFRTCELIAPITEEDCVSFGFTDEESFESWYVDEVNFIAHLGLMVGSGDGTFEPDTTADRAMAATVLVRFQLMLSMYLS